MLSTILVPFKMLMSCDEFEKLATELGSCELIDGKINALPPGGFEHNFTVSNFTLVIGNFVVQHRFGWSLSNQVGICTRENLPRVRGADFVFISYNKVPRDKPAKGFLRVAPELVVEVLDYVERWKDLEEKVGEYHSIGVEMVWVADPHTRTVKTFPRAGEPVVIHDGSAIDGGTILPGFNVPIAEFFDL